MYLFFNTFLLPFLILLFIDLVFMYVHTPSICFNRLKLLHILQNIVTLQVAAKKAVLAETLEIIANKF